MEEGPAGAYEGHEDNTTLHRAAASPTAALGRHFERSDGEAYSPVLLHGKATALPRSPSVIDALDGES